MKRREEERPDPEHRRPVAVVTGASAGVGRALVRELARRGFDLGLVARGTEGLAAAGADVETLGGRSLALPADVADAPAIERAAAIFEERLGPIDVWVNNAMVTVLAPVEAVSAADYRRVTEVTYLGTVHGTKAVLPRMLERDHGTIVQVGSALAYRSIPLQSAYCAAKFAVRGFTDSLRCELLHRKSAVRLCMVQLPALNTPQFDWCRTTLDHVPQPVPPIFQPELAARAIADAVMAPKREVWVGFPTWKAILGAKLAPGFADRYLGRHGYESQQSETPLGERHDNLYRPLPGDHGAHGRFDPRARARSLPTRMLHGWQRWRRRFAPPLR